MKDAGMQDHLQSPEAAGWLAAILYKFLPGALGALVMVLVDPPKTKRDVFARALVAFICSMMVGEPLMDYLRSFEAFAWLDPLKGSHIAAVYFAPGVLGWFVIGGAVQLAARWRDNPSLAGFFGAKQP